MARRPAGRGTIVLAIGGLLAGCSGGTAGPSGDPPTSHYVALNPFGGVTGFALGLSLTVSGGTVTGTGWMSGLETPVLPMTVSGTLVGDTYALSFVHSRVGSPVATFAGTRSGGNIVGVFTQCPGCTANITLTAQAVGASGSHASTLSGAVNEQQTSGAGFGGHNGLFFLHFGYSGRNYPIAELGRTGGRPAVGTHTFGPGSSWEGAVIPTYAPSQVFYEVTGGTLHVTVSTPYAFVGEAVLTAEDKATGRVLTLRGQFGAGCTTTTCQ